MAKQVQLRRGTTSQHNTFTGAVGEVTVDTDKDTLVVHDGSTAGGFPLARQSSVDLKANLASPTFTGKVTVQHGSDNGIAFPNDAYGGAVDTAGITLISNGGEATALTLKVTNDADDIINLITPSTTGLKHNSIQVANINDVNNVKMTVVTGIDTVYHDVSRPDGAYNERWEKDYYEVFNPTANSIKVKQHIQKHWSVCACDGGNGCVIETTNIKTPNGVKQIKDIKENDLILVKNKEVRVIYSISCPLNGRNLIKINENIICTEDHAWLLNDDSFTVFSLEKYEEKRNIVLNDNGREIGFVGLVDKSMLKQLEIGDVLKNGIIVTSIEKYNTNEDLHMLFTENGLFETDSGFISEAHLNKF